MKSNYFILAGTSGAGKTSVLNALKNLGYSCHDEVTRKVLEQQIEVDGPALPAKDPLRFVQAMLEQFMKDFEAPHPESGPVFFDRGIPDLVAYAKRFGIDPSSYEKTSSSYLYNPTVFIFKPWKEIFVNDDLRKGSFEMYEEFHRLIVNSYEQFNYNLCSVPFDTVESRCQFIINEAQARCSP